MANPLLLGINRLCHSNHRDVYRFDCLERNSLRTPHDVWKRYGQHCDLLRVFYEEMDNKTACHQMVETKKVIRAQLNTDESESAATNKSGF